MAGRELNVSVDTNVLVRLAVNDDPDQSAAAELVLRQAEVVLCSLPMLCEVVWVLTNRYRYSKTEVFHFLSQLLAAENIQADRSVVEMGISCLLAGGDFADGVIAELGRKEGADVFLTFDRKARKAIGGLGIPVASPDQIES